MFQVEDCEKRSQFQIKYLNFVKLTTFQGFLKV